MSGAIFDSSKSALIFAFTFAAGARPERDSVNKISTPSTGSGRGLGGMDGAAQAGMVLGELKRSGMLIEQVLTARLAMRAFICSCRSPCCSGSRPNDTWREAVSYMSDHVYQLMQSTHSGKRGMEDNYRLRKMMTGKYFGIEVDVKEIAKRAEVSERTAHQHRKAIYGHLHRIESNAWIEIEARLVSVGIVSSITGEEECLDKTQ